MVKEKGAEVSGLKAKKTTKDNLNACEDPKKKGAAKKKK